MSTLLLRLAAPMQSWGADSKYNIRKTGREPTKSGVLGMIAAALGCRRDDVQVFAELNRLHFGVRVDHEGEIRRDYQTVHGKADKETTITYRDYLHDSIFVAGLEGERTELEKLEDALRHPVYPLFLGRRSCPPAGPICLGIQDKPLEDALRECPWQLPKWRQDTARKSLRLVLDSTDGLACQQDAPISYSPIKREYGWRNIQEKWILCPEAETAEHDPMAELWEVPE